jgi:hypothetical protein
MISMWLKCIWDVIFYVVARNPPFLYMLMHSIYAISIYARFSQDVTPA